MSCAAAVAVAATCSTRATARILIRWSHWNLAGPLRGIPSVASSPLYGYAASSRCQRAVSRGEWRYQQTFGGPTGILSWCHSFNTRGCADARCQDCHPRFFSHRLLSHFQPYVPGAAPPFERLSVGVSASRRRARQDSSTAVCSTPSCSWNQGRDIAHVLSPCQAPGA